MCYCCRKECREALLCEAAGAFARLKAKEKEAFSQKQPSQAGRAPPPGLPARRTPDISTKSKIEQLK